MKLPDTAYIIIQCEGADDYDVYVETPVRAFSHREDADELLSELDSIAAAGSTLTTLSRATLRKTIANEYKRFGVEGNERSAWRLAECPLTLTLPMRVMRQFRGAKTRGPKDG